MTSPSSYQAFYQIIARIPAGKVATYGQIALLAGLPGQARQVGYALHALPNPELPWHRVVNARGRLSLRQGAELQRSLLEAEGIQFTPDSQIDLTRYQWQPQGPQE